MNNMAFDLVAVDLRFEHHPTGLGVPLASPRLSWRLDTASQTVPEHWIQTSYHVEVERHPGTATSQFQVDSKSTVLVPWPDKPLMSGEPARVRVKSTGSTSSSEDISSSWSAWATIEVSCLKRQDWTAKVISAPLASASGNPHPDGWGIRPARFRKTFKAPTEARRARLYVTALGLYEAYLNGRKVGDELLAPGWTSYQGRIQYQVFDVKNLLNKGGDNVLSFEVAKGWYAGRLLWGVGISNFYGNRIGVLAQLDMVTTGDEKFRVATDETWEYTASPIVGSDIYDGEACDLRLAPAADWNLNAAASEGAWTRVDILDLPDADLVASSSPPLRVTETIRPIKIFKDPDGTTLVDFGQNIAGKVHIPYLDKPAGHCLRIRHAEVLEHSRLGTRPLRRARQTDTVVFGSKPLQDWSPRFTYHGFRYVELVGWPADEMDFNSITALVMHTDMRRTGRFACSNPQVNQLHKNIVWSTRGNFVSIPTDCPQRDERLGWTGDLQVFSSTASFLFDCAGMLSNWLADLVIEQRASGGIVPLVVPNVMKHGPWPAVPQAVWDDVIILLPWTLYHWFGDVGALADTYPGMCDYLRTLQRGDDGLWDPKLWQLGDWLDPNAPPAEPGLAITDGVLVADSYLIHVTGLMAKIAKVLGKDADHVHYKAEADRLRGLFHDKYVTRAGFIISDSQTAMALALLFGLVDEPAQKSRLADRLARLVRYSKFRVSTGFAGTPAILHALSEGGYTNLAYAMLLEPECPSWMYPVRMGATTMWERWDSMLPDGSINPGQMTSFNHYALGSVAEWMHAYIGGVTPLEPGWARFSVAPQPGGDITSADVSFDGPQGRVEVSWQLKGGEDFSMNIAVPLNSVAVVCLPDGKPEREMGSGRFRFTCKADNLKSVEWPVKPLLTEFRDHPGYQDKYK